MFEQLELGPSPITMLSFSNLQRAQTQRPSPSGPPPDPLHLFPPPPSPPASRALSTWQGRSTPSGSTLRARPASGPCAHWASLLRGQRVSDAGPRKGLRRRGGKASVTFCLWNTCVRGATWQSLCAPKTLHREQVGTSQFRQ